MGKEKRPARSTLEATPERVLRFLTACGRSRAIRRALASVGFGRADAKQAWALLQAAAGDDLLDDVADLGEKRPHPAEALAAWGARFLARADAILDDFPAQRAYLLANGTRAGSDLEGFSAVTGFLERLEKLAAGEAHTGTPDADSAALAALARVGLDAAERARGDGLLRAITTARPDVPLPPAVDFPARLHDLWRWYRRWSTLARTVVTRRDHLIQLGLASRRSRASNDA